MVGLPPIGCVPSQRTLGGGITRECVDLRNQAAKSFNSKLAQQLKMLEANLPGSKVIYIDIYTILDNLILRPSDYGNSILHHMTSICYFVRMLCTSNDPFALSLFKISFLEVTYFEGTRCLGFSHCESTVIVTKFLAKRFLILIESWKTDLLPSI